MADSQEISQVANLVMSIMSQDEPTPSTSRESSTSFSAGKYMPERLLDFKHGEDGRKIYLVKWFGYPHEENTWESENNLSCHYMMQELVEKKHKLRENGEAAYFLNSHLHPSKYVTGTLSGFDLGRTPELILGATERDGDIQFLVKWKGVFEADMVPRSIANIRCPQQVIEFYEERMRWFSPEEAPEEEESEIETEDENDKYKMDEEE